METISCLGTIITFELVTYFTFVKQSNETINFYVKGHTLVNAYDGTLLVRLNVFPIHECRHEIRI